MTDITRKRGDTYADEFVLKSKKTQLPLDITGCSFLLTVDPTAAPVDASANLYQLTGVIVGAGTDGRVSFAPNDSQANQLGKFFYDVQMIDASGKKRTVDSGKYIYTQDITK
jgi:hypothetical protein